MEFCMKPIGEIRTPFTEISQAPIQSLRATFFGEIEVFSEKEAGLDSIDGLSYLILIYVFHAALNSTQLMVKLFLDNELHGIFATRFYWNP